MFSLILADAFLVAFYHESLIVEALWGRKVMASIGRAGSGGLTHQRGIKDRVAIATRGIVRAHLRVRPESRADTQVRPYGKITVCLGHETAQKVASFVILRERSD